MGTDSSFVNYKLAGKCRDLRFINLEEFLDLLFPYNHCLLCGNLIPAQDVAKEIKFCRICQQKLTGYICCPNCAVFVPEAEFHPEAALHHHFCKACLPDAIQGMTAAAPYARNVREALLRLKYKGKRRVARPLGQETAKAWLRTGWQADVILPVPLHEAKLKQRGYNQCELLAAECGRILGLPVLTQALLRVKETAVQNQLNPTEREQNVSSAFAGGPEAEQLGGKKLILLDDIITTGSTMRACAAALQNFKPAVIYGLAVAGKLMRD